MSASPPSPPSASSPPAAASLRVPWAGRMIDLHPEGVIVDPATATVYVADTHFGKPASYRRLGVPVPDGGAVADAAILSALLERTGASRLVILGDFLHDAAARSPETLAALAAWRERHAGLEVVLVRGNHDLRAGDPPAELEIRCEPEPWDDGGIICRHHPPAPSETVGSTPVAGPVAADAIESPVLAGHLHPVAVLRGRRRGSGRQRCRCFHVGRSCLVLPAFGSFTGGMVVQPRPGERLYVIGPGAVVPVDLV